VSLEPGRKLGLTASLINVIVPAVVIALYGVLIYSSIASVFSILSGGHAIGSAPLASGIFVTFIALGVVSVIGIILFLVSMHGLSQYYNERGIFTNVLYGFLISIIGGAVVFSVVFAYIFLSITSVASTRTYNPSVFPTFILVLLGIFVSALVIGIVSAIFYMRAFNKLGNKSGVNSFNTAGLLYLIGAVLTIVLIGGVIIWTAWIFATLGFKSLKPKAAEIPTYTYSAPQTTATSSFSQVKYCQYCGAHNALDAVYCTACGKQLQPTP
jgi:uncharacterized membrane protein/ribosomal protein L40E